MKVGEIMATEIDGLQISISADASKAEKSIDNLISTLGKLHKKLIEIDTKQTGISDLSDEAVEMDKAVSKATRSMCNNLRKAMFGSSKNLDSFMKSIENAGKTKVFSGLAEHLPEEISKMETKLDSLLAKEERFIKLGQNVDSCIFRPLRAHCTVFWCMVSARTVHSFRSSEHCYYSGTFIPFSFSNDSSNITRSSR